MNHCETCVFWQPDDVEIRVYRVFVGRCNSPKFVEEFPYEEDNLVYSYSEGGCFRTGPKFGCVHHAPVKE